MPKTKDNMLLLQQRFAKELSEQSFALPLLLLDSYSQLGLSDSEFVALLKLLSAQKKGALPAGQFASLCAVSEGDAEELRSKLEQACLLSVDTDGNADFLPLYNALFDLWVFGQMAQADTQRPEEKAPVRKRSKGSKLLRSFEKEFGRALSPIETEKIMQWAAVDKLPDDMIEEALHRAILQGKRSFAYIDRILLNWQRSGYKTLAEVMAEDKPLKTGAKGRKNQNASDNYDSIYDKLMQ